MQFYLSLSMRFCLSLTMVTALHGGRVRVNFRHECGFIDTFVVSPWCRKRRPHTAQRRRRQPLR